jgi:hypothetical protein
MSSSLNLFQCTPFLQPLLLGNYANTEEGKPCDYLVSNSHSTVDNRCVPPLHGTYSIADGLRSPGGF